MIDKIQDSSEAYLKSHPSYIKITLMRCACEAIAKSAVRGETPHAAEATAGCQGVTNSNVRVAEWVGTLESIHQDQRHSNFSDVVSNSPSILSGDEASTVLTSATSAQRIVQDCEPSNLMEDISKDDLDTDLAKTALDTGAKAFKARDWEEADSFFQEALRVIQQLPKQQRKFCDFFNLQYKLAVCAYYTQEPAIAKQALESLVQQSASSDEQRERISNVVHLLSQLYIRMGHLDRARGECEKALQARRRLLDKQSDASLESTALMSYIYILLDNRTRARSYLAIIPEARRDELLRGVEECLTTEAERLSSPPILTRLISGDSGLAINLNQHTLPAPSLTQSTMSPASEAISQWPGGSPRQQHERIRSSGKESGDHQSIENSSIYSAREDQEPKFKNQRIVNGVPSTDPEAFGATALISSESLETNEPFKTRALSRKDILNKVRCQPKTRVEEAVCEGNHTAFVNLLSKKNRFWQSKLRKHVRPERVTALHFAALFGEIDITRRLLSSGFTLNKISYRYSTGLTLLKFAIGARQVDMVRYLIENGAKPIEPDSWSTLAGQLMNRSWLMKTMSDIDKESVPNQIMAILEILLKHRWDVNRPFGTSGGTVLHQAVTFWTGSYQYDLQLRPIVTQFLCEWGADPCQRDLDGRTPYDLASASGHREVLLVLDRTREAKPVVEPAECAELPSGLG